MAAVVACMMLTKQIKTNVTPRVSNGLFLLSAGQWAYLPSDSTVVRVSFAFMRVIVV